MKTQLLSLTTILACLINPAVAPAQTELAFRVIDVKGSGSTQAYSKIVDSMNSLLDQTGVQECAELNIRLEHIGTFQDPNVNNLPISSNITRRGLLDDVTDHGGNVLVLRALSVCGGLTGTNIAGCASPSSALTVEYFDNPLIAALVWLHELGHSANLSWITDGNAAHTPDAARLMYYSISQNRDDINAAECLRYAQLTNVFEPGEGAAVLADDIIGPPASEDPEDLMLAETEQLQAVEPLESEQLEIILSELWNHGVPTAELDPIFSEEANLEAIREVLSDVDLLPFWPSAVLILGEYGVENDLDLIAFALGRRMVSDQASSDTIRRFKLSAVEAASVLTARTGSSKGVDLIAEIAFSLPSLGYQGEAAAVILEGVEPDDEQFFENDLLSVALYGAALIDGETGSDLIARLKESQSARAGATAIIEESLLTGTDSVGGQIDDPRIIGHGTGELAPTPDIFSDYEAIRDQVQAQGIESLRP